ncbi:hypothetical protein HJFPF1_08695 [Paramyrothecium foliicola]|nr:hypothetical protein HJFPF1_08695 [Paramyrothecium foliicola]
MYRSILSLNFLSATGSYWAKGSPYLTGDSVSSAISRCKDELGEGKSYLSVAAWPSSAALDTDGSLRLSVRADSVSLSARAIPTELLGV